MMAHQINSKFKKLFTQSPQKTARKVIFKIRKNSRDYIQQRKDKSFCTRTEEKIQTINNSYINVAKLDISNIDTKTADYLSKMYLDHRFDLLGSGWVKNSYECDAAGLENHKYCMNKNIEYFDSDGDWLNEILLPAHAEKSKEIWRYVSDGYIPIDWQKDFKSGYRWSVKEWYKNQFVQKPGVDIKVPWELARLQHLPQMALFSMTLPDIKEILIREFKNQILDFITTNPPRMGVNWTCTMDVAIRAANMLVAYDIFNQSDNGHILDSDFKRIFAQSNYEHGYHIVNNLEWSEELTNNHYLADIAGLLFISAYLADTEETECWMPLALQELIYVFKRQFYDDGGNFESSTSYHCLSLEMIVYTAALVLGLDENKKNTLKEFNRSKWKTHSLLNPYERQEYKLDTDSIFTEWFTERIYKAGMFLRDITKPDGMIPQIGDNDSGLFLKFSPNGEFISVRKALSTYPNLKDYKTSENEYWDQNILNRQTLLSALGGLFGQFDDGQEKNDFLLEKSLVKSLSKNRTFQCSYLDEKCRYFSNSHILSDINKLRFSRETIIKPSDKSSVSLTENTEWKTYSNSGIFIFKSIRIHLTICATPIGQNGLGGHDHNDKLSFELYMDGKNVYVDPGTYLYTASINARNRFRSVKSHNTIVVNDEEQNQWLDGYDGLFSLKNETEIELLEIDSNSIILKAKYRNTVHVRQFQINNSEILIKDFCNYDFKVIMNDSKIYSHGYGKLVSYE